MRPERIAIIGVGLIGGSLGLALRRKGFDGVIEGYGRQRSTLELALQIGAVDTISLDLEEAGGEGDRGLRGPVPHRRREGHILGDHGEGEDNPG